MGVGGSKSAKLKIKGMDELAAQISRLGEASIAISKKVVYAGAEPVADEIRKGLEKNLIGSEYTTGDLEDSLGIAPPDLDKNGDINTHVGFDGYDSKGIPNALKARAMESGTSTIDKRPFVRPAINRSREKSIQAMQQKYEEEAEKL